MDSQKIYFNIYKSLTTYKNDWYLVIKLKNLTNEQYKRSKANHLIELSALNKKVVNIPSLNEQ